MASEAESFRTGWQSLLASLGTSMEGFRQTEADQGNSSAGPAPRETAKKSSVSTSTLAAGANLRQGQGSEKGSGETDAANFSPAINGTGKISIQRAAGTIKTASTKTEETKPAAEPEGESVSSSRSIHSIKAAKPLLAAAEPAPDLVSATSPSFPQTVPVAGISSAVIPAADFKTHSAQTDFPAVKAQSVQTDSSRDPATGIVSASLSSHPPELASTSEIARPASAAVQETAEEFETPAKQRQVSPVSSQSGSFGPTLSEAESSAVGEGAPPPVSARVEGGNPLETPAPDQSRTQAEASSLNSTEALAPSQIPTQGGSVLPASVGSDGVNPLPQAARAAAQSNQIAAAPPSIQGKHDPAAGGKNSTSEPLRSARGTSNSDAVQHQSRLIDGQPSGPAADASAMARVPAGAHGMVSTAGEPAGGSTAASAGPDSRETFATLDAEAASGNPVWIHAGAHRAEAGFQDPTLGWVGVRADASGGGIHAELVPNSTDAAQALGSHLAGLNAYLAERHTPVETLTLTAPESGWAGMGSDKGAGEGMQQGAGQHTGQGTAQGADAGFQSGPSLDSSIQSPATLPELLAFSGGLDASAQTAGQGGIHISVMA
jgi:hypothetical protein